jgi:hypothetical protein
MGQKAGNFSEEGAASFTPAPLFSQALVGQRAQRGYVFLTMSGLLSFLKLILVAR